VRHGGGQRLVGVETAKAAAKIAAAVDGDECPARRLQRAAAIGLRRRLASDSGLNRPPGKREEPLPILEADHQIAAAM
jgi:hypothetical protein